VKAWLAPAAVALLPVAAALYGARGPLRVELSLGPGDGPYVSGFAPMYEIDDHVGTHWTTYNAGVALPLSVQGAPVAVAYRYARVFGETARVEVRDAAGQTIDGFSARGGAWMERTTPVGAAPGALELSIVSDSHERQDRGLKLDWVRFEVPAGARLRLEGTARWLPALLVAIVMTLLRLLGWRVRAAALLALPWALVLTALLLRDPWLVHRLLRGVPLALAVAGLAGDAAGQWLYARGRVSAQTLRLVGVLAVTAFLIRAAAVNHPGFYYPDQRTHARLVEQIQKDGLAFFATPSRSIEEHGVWRTFAYGRKVAFPYTPAFHLPFTPLPLPYDTLLAAMKLAAAAVSVVPLVLVWAMARRVGASPLGAVLMLFIPTYTSRLSFAFFPSLFGHAVDMAFLYWLMGRVDRFAEPRTWLLGAAWVCACQLAYVSGVINTGVFVLSLALVFSVVGGPRRLRVALGLLAMGALGALASVLLYYRDFLGMAAGIAERATGDSRASHYPVQSWWAVAYGRTRAFFDAVYPVLAAAGVYLLRAARAAPVLFAWALAYALLLLGRARVPDVFLHGHETLFATPLVCLAAGEALARLGDPGGRAAWRRAAAGLVLAFLAVQGFVFQWRALADQLGNAR
jgi:hypothetical protein